MQVVLAAGPGAPFRYSHFAALRATQGTWGRQYDVRDINEALRAVQESAGEAAPAREGKPQAARGSRAGHGAA